MDVQLGLFPEAPPAARAADVGSVTASDDLRALAGRLPRGVRLGTSSWSFPGWHSIIYDRAASEATLASDGLAAYAAHPLLRAVGIDRSYYRPLTVDRVRAYAEVVPDDFRFVVKADRALTSPTDPQAVGVRSPNPLFLDAAYATREVIRPLASLEGKAGPLVFQFSPISPRLVGGRAAFFERLQRFLEALPGGTAYAVELRTPALLTEEYARLLESTGTTHCYSVHPAMSPLERQLDLIQPFYQPVLLVRWMLRAGLGYEAARERYQPFDRIVDEDLATRDLIARTVLDALLGEREAFVIANNKAEGSAPLTLFRLAARIGDWGHADI